MNAMIIGTSTEEFFPSGCRMETAATKYGDVDYFISGDVLFVLRHKAGHKLAPSAINYRANVQILKDMGVDKVITTHAVGSITQKLLPTGIGIISDFIDFTSMRQSTFFDGISNPVKHVEMVRLFDEEMKMEFFRKSISQNISVSPSLVYVTTNGPRLESPAEIRAYRALGADVVGMTLNPEVNLIHELGIRLLSVCFSINWAAGLDEEGVSFIEKESLKRLSENVMRISISSLEK